MFHLESAISDWRSQMLAAGIQSPIPLEELEAHLREEIEQQLNSGMDAYSAFEKAVQKLGRAAALKNEFEAGKRANARAHRRLKIFLGILFCSILLPVNFYLTDDPKTLCLIDLLLLSCVLPLMASLKPKNHAYTRSPLKTVWKGQIACALCGLLIDTPYPAFGLLAAIVCCLAFAFALQRQSRPAIEHSGN